jgi:hypothetical protein
MDLRYGAGNHDIGLGPQKPRSYDNLHACNHMQNDTVLETCKELVTESMFIAEQRSLNRGLKIVGKRGLILWYHNSDNWIE